MSLVHFFFSFRGRISRQAWWLGYIFLFVAAILVTRALFPESLDAEVAGVMPPPGAAETLVSLAFCWPSAAISAKRFNDRDWPWWTGILIGALYAVYVIANWAGLFLDPDTMPPAERSAFVLFLVAFVATIVDNGFFRGTTGPNRYGPDPIVQPSR
jgi:uncharacterized membrane protein YhaH (DUF805 family)